MREGSILGEQEAMCPTWGSARTGNDHKWEQVAWLTTGRSKELGVRGRNSNHLEAAGRMRTGSELGSRSEVEDIRGESGVRGEGQSEWTVCLGRGMKARNPQKEVS